MIPVSKVKSYSPELLRGSIMVVSNEDKPILVGNIIGFEEVSQSKRLIPIVDVDGERYMCMGILLPYDGRLKALLDDLSGAARFELLRKIFWLREDLNHIADGHAQLDIDP